MTTLVLSSMFSPPVIVLLTVPSQCFFCGSFLQVMVQVCLCYAAVSVPCSLVVTCWEKADIWVVLCVVFSCVFVLIHFRTKGGDGTFKSKEEGNDQESIQSSTTLYLNNHMGKQQKHKKTPHTGE